MRSKSSPSGHKKKIISYVEDVKAEVKAQIPRRATRREYAKEAIKGKFAKSPRSSRRLVSPKISRIDRDDKEWNLWKSLHRQGIVKSPVALIH